MSVRDFSRETDLFHASAAFHVKLAVLQTWGAMLGKSCFVLGNLKYEVLEVAW